MRVLLFTRGLMHGGAERQLCLLANGLGRRGHSVTVMVYYGGMPLERELHVGAGGVSLKSLGKKGRWEIFGFLWRLISTLRAGRYDVIYSFLPLPNFLMAMMRPFTGKARLIWALRGSSMSWGQYDRLTRISAWLERSLCRVPDMIIANSEAGRAYSVRLGYPRDRLRVVENGIDSETFQFNEDGRRALRHHWGIAEDEILIGVVARLDPMKGLETFLYAASLLLRYPERYRFVWVGDGSASAFRMEVERLGLSSVLWFEPVRNDMPATYSAFDIVCLPSSFGEGFPNVVAEAMSCERTVVATDVGDVRRLVGAHGALVPPGDAEALAQALHAAAKMAAAGKRCADARDWVVSQFGVDALVVKTEAVLQEALASDRRQR